MILCIETATSVCSVALCDRERIIASRLDNGGRSHASLLTVFIGELFSELKIQASDLEAVAVSKGPGSFTGLRIGVSVAKGIAYRTSLPLIGVNTLLSLYHGIRPSAEKTYGLGPGSLLCPMLDARRAEVYCSLFRMNGEEFRATGAEVIGDDSFTFLPSGTRLLLFGPGADKCHDLVKRENTVIETGFAVSAENMRIPAYAAFDAGKFEDTAYFEPFYLKDFIATVPRKNILGQ
jgi:tRNA threonylcarbamoyladenosine biosynthesis protein TsaB